VLPESHDLVPVSASAVEQSLLSGVNPPPPDGTSDETLLLDRFSQCLPVLPQSQDHAPVSTSAVDRAQFTEVHHLPPDGPSNETVFADRSVGCSPVLPESQDHVPVSESAVEQSRLTEFNEQPPGGTSDETVFMDRSVGCSPVPLESADVLSLSVSAVEQTRLTEVNQPRPDETSDETVFADRSVGCSPVLPESHDLVPVSASAVEQSLLSGVNPPPPDGSSDDTLLVDSFSQCLPVLPQSRDRVPVLETAPDEVDFADRAVECVPLTTELPSTGQVMVNTSLAPEDQPRSDSALLVDAITSAEPILGTASEFVDSTLLSADQRGALWGPMTTAVPERTIVGVSAEEFSSGHDAASPSVALKDMSTMALVQPRRRRHRERPPKEDKEVQCVELWDGESELWEILGGSDPYIDERTDSPPA
jgi:hypothetical protein